jgi:hypothetical protein
MNIKGDDSLTRLAASVHASLDWLMFYAPAASENRMPEALNSKAISLRWNFAARYDALMANPHGSCK